MVGNPPANSLYFYPRSPCGERRYCHRYIGFLLYISIHALLAESDTIFAVRPYDAPIFLSTLSLRRATRTSCRCRVRPKYFYPRSPCGERLRVTVHTCRDASISIHALLAESDQCPSRKTGRPLLFLSTLSLRRATQEAEATVSSVKRISIHALLAESDPFLSGKGLSFLRFLSTLSLRRATPL